MARSVLLACLAALTLTAAAADFSAQLGPEAVTQYCAVSASNLQGCSSELYDLELQVRCCTPFNLMRELDCFCSPITRQSAKGALTPDVLEALQSCDFGEFDIMDVDISCAREAYAAEDAAMEATLASEADPAPERPVLDLSALLDGQPGDATDDLQVGVYASGTMTINFEVDLDADDEVTFDVEVTDDADSSVDLQVDIEVGEDTKVLIEVDDGEVVAFMASDFADADEVDIDFSSESMTGNPALDRLFTWAGVLPCADSLSYTMLDSRGPDGSVEIDVSFGDDDAGDEASAGDSTFVIDVDVDLPAELRGALGAADVTIEMDLNMAQLAEEPARLYVSQGDAAVGVHELTSQDLSAVLNRASEWVASILPESRPAQTASVTSVLEGVTELLSHIGAEVGQRLPQGNIQPGKAYEFDIEPSEALRGYFEASGAGSSALVAVEDQPRDPKAGRKTMDALAAAVSSSLFASRSDAAKAGRQECQLCRWVHANLGLLWGIVYANLALLMCCFVMAAVRYARTSVASDLEEPLIVDAAEFAAAMERKSLLEPVWEPAHKPQL